jgi:hypothetical protein
MAASPTREQLGLADLARVSLPERQREGLERMRETALGSASWRARKIESMRELFALEQISERLTIRAADAISELRVVMSLRTPVPCMPPEATDLVVEQEAELVLRYPEEILLGPLPGYAIVEILAPRHVFLASVGTAGPSQRLCLGANVPRGYPLREAVLASYAAFTMQTVAIDERDHAGVMNGESARWWQSNAARIPLSTEPFLSRDRSCESSSQPNPGKQQ